MAKRLSDTEKWKKPFIKSLPVEYKLFWFYLLDDCDHAGVWNVDHEVAEIRLGTKLSLQKAQGFFKEKIVVFDDGAKWFIPDFIPFQYGYFDEKNKMYKSIIAVLEKYNLIPHLSPINGGMVKRKEMEQVMVKEAISEKKEFLENQKWKEEFCMAKRITMQELEALQKDWLTDIELKRESVTNHRQYFTNWYNKVLPKPGNVKTMQY